MLLNILKQLNWVDIIIAFLLLRILYISTVNGFVIELFKLIGIISSIYISFHYFVICSDFVMRRVSTEQHFPLEFMDFLIFVFLVIIVYLVFVLFRKVVCHFVKMEAVPLLSKWGGLILGMGRGILTASLVVFILSISTIPYLNTSAKEAYSGRRLFNIAVSTYSSLWEGVMHKFTVNEKFNKVITEIQKDFNK